MSDESPLFVSLPLANAVELILKDHVIDLGMSIYEAKTTKTLGIWDCTSRLAEKGIEFPEIPVLQLLIDDRNNIQHRFGHPTAEATYYYIKQVVNFFQRFLNEHYNIQLFEALKSN